MKAVCAPLLLLLSLTAVAVEQVQLRFATWPRWKVFAKIR
jgi:hypothetical protein